MTLIRRNVWRLVIEFLSLIDFSTGIFFPQLESGIDSKRRVMRHVNVLLFVRSVSVGFLHELLCLIYHFDTEEK